jgi:hypothetical protein
VYVVVEVRETVSSAREQVYAHIAWCLIKQRDNFTFYSILSVPLEYENAPLYINQGTLVICI